MSNCMILPVVHGTLVRPTRTEPGSLAILVTAKETAASAFVLRLLAATLMRTDAPSGWRHWPRGTLRLMRALLVMMVMMVMVVFAMAEQRADVVLAVAACTHILQAIIGIIVVVQVKIKLLIVRVTVTDGAPRVVVRVRRWAAGPSRPTKVLRRGGTSALAHRAPMRAMRAETFGCHIGEWRIAVFWTGNYASGATRALGGRERVRVHGTGTVRRRGYVRWINGSDWS